VQKRGKSDAGDGPPRCGDEPAAGLAGLGVPDVAFTPDLFTDPMAAAIRKHGVRAAGAGIAKVPAAPRDTTAAAASNR
jgi:hypothetical protein